MSEGNNMEIVEMIVRRGTRYQQMSVEERRAADTRFVEFMDKEMDEEPDFDGGGNEGEDEDNCTYNPAEESDAETEGFVEINEDIDDDDDEEEENDVQQADDNFYIAKDGTRWYKKPLPNSRTLVHNVVDFTRRRPGPTGTVHDPYTIFRSIITDVIIRETNAKGRKVTAEWNLAKPTKKKDWKPLTVKEFEAFLAILLYSGLTKSNDEPASELWGATRCPIYKAAMSFDRFRCIRNFIRFDNGYTRESDLATEKLRLLMMFGK